MASSKSSTLQVVVLTLFCAPFCLGGLALLGFGIYQASSPGVEMQRSVLFLLLGLVFAGAGFGLLYAYSKGSTMQAREERIRAAHPGQPWMWREDWAIGRVRSNTRSSLTGSWIFAVFWNLVSSPILLIRPPVWEQDPKGYLALLFPAIGAGLLAWAILQTLRARRFGQTWFAMEAVPAALGGELRGSIQTRLPAPPERGVLLKLSCVLRTVSGSGKDRSVSESIQWREERAVTAGEIQTGPGAAFIPVRFAIPADGLEANREKSDTGMFWFLSAEASLAGVDYKDEFEIPVFRTKDSPAAGSGPAFASFDAPASFATVTPSDLAKAGITVGPSPDGMEFRFAAARNPSAAAGLTGFALLWTGILWFLHSVKVPVIFPVVFGLFEALFVLIALDLWFGSVRVSIAGGVLQRRYALAGIPISTRAMPAADVSKLKLKVGMQSGGRAGTPYYDLRAVLLNGREQTLAGSIRDKHQAEWLAAQMSAALGLKSA